MKNILPLVIALSIIAGVFIGRYMQLGSNEQSVQYRMIGSNKIDKVLETIMNEYVDNIDISKLEDAAIKSIIDSLDPHSLYIPKEELKEVNEPIEGKFSGIGVQFNIQNDTVVVIRTIPNGPSEKLGIQPGDRIVRIEDSTICGKNLSSDLVVKKLKGKKGTKVKISIFRNSLKELVDYEITRDDIPLYSVDVSYMLDKKTGYIKINSFSKTTAEEFKEHSKKLLNIGMSQYIVDLRGNGGGILAAAIEIADEFLPQGKLIVYTEGKAVPRSDVYATEGGFLESIPVLVLIDEWSASASEIVAGALQDNDRGTIVGRRSFGKGLVQQQIDLMDGSAIRLTVARYYTPTGRSIQKPYAKGAEEYELDLVNRINHGELFSRDSIHFPDSLKFTTPNGKTVYGGGGIMPDVFVAHDTSMNSAYYSQIMDKGLVFKFAFIYSDKNRTSLTSLKTAEDIKAYLVKREAIKEFIAFCSSQQVMFDPVGYKKSESVLKTLIMAYIARNIIDNDGFFPIQKEIDYTLLESIKLLQ